VFAPLDTGRNVIIDNKPASAAFHRHITGEDLDLFTALRAFFDNERGCHQVRGAGAVIKHARSSPVSKVVSQS
jgi:hypothetical protein